MVSLQSKEDYESLHPDAWGIPTPSAASISERDKCLSDAGIGLDGLLSGSTSNESLDMVIMPGMAFDKELARLGHGKGYYDFFLQKLHQQANVTHGQTKMHMPFLVGLALKEQLFNNEQKIPTDESDWPLDALIVGDGSVIRK
ncbi:hypothetical protein MMC07_009785 [Pseudocyphellaria aurata]|nr:hypothetical protein [Pseudocyphellaria aurata]